MEIAVNGRPVETGAATVAELLAELGMGADRVAVERNLTLVPRRQWAQERLAAGDRIEVVQFVGGGA